MKRHFYVLLMLLLTANSIFGQIEGFDPFNPPEPNAQYNLNLQAVPSGAGNLYGGGKKAASENVYVYAYNTEGFRFKSWMEDGQVISTSYSFYYSMPARDVTLIAVFEYDPGNPAEPNPIPRKYALNLVAQPNGAGSFNRTSGDKCDEGSSVDLYAYANTGFIFKEWRDGDNILSTDRNYSYPMPSENKTLTAVYYYDPDAPSEPNEPAGVEHGLIALTQSGEAGWQIAYPIYLLNYNIDVHSVEFDIAFPEDAAVDYSNAALSGRTNGHAITVTPTDDAQYHVVIGNETGNSFFDSNGILLTIPVTIPVGWNPGETYPVTISNVVLGTPSGIITSSAKNGGLSLTEGVDHSVYANFYPTQFLNRVLFTNLSSETATDFLWDFGDGTTSTECEPLHVYATSGNYEVMLKAFNEYASDSSKIVVGINHENYWNVSGVLSLNKQKKEVKNYASPEELFQMLSQTAITGNVIIQVEAGETFNYTLTSASESILTGIRNRLAEGNYKLILQKDGDADNPAINFTGIPGKELITALIRLGQYIEIEEVNLKIYGQVMDITKIYDFTPQEISSGTASAPVDFTVISNSFVYDWSLVSASESVTGYAQSGTNVIPSTILTNNSLLEGVVKYGVSISFMEIELYSFEYQITVLPDLPDLQVASIEIPDGIIENGTFIISALITNAGKNIVEEKNRIDGIWRSKEPEFDARTAALIGTISSERALTPDDSYTVSFELTAPADSMAVYYYFVAADIYNAIRESEETNNWLRSNPVTVYPYMMDETDYTNLLTFYNHFGGISWTNRQWNIASMRIFNNWGSITFDRGRVTKIELPSNNVTGELSDMLYHFPYLTTLNLYDNRLSGSLSDLSGSDNRPDSLVALNLGRNQLKGTIPASVSNWIYLTNLNLSYNQLTDLEEALPENIVQLNLQSQSFAVDSITLSSRPLLPLPSIVRYNHAGRNFDFYPSWQLYRSNTLLLSYYPDDNRYQWNIASVGSEKDFVWKYDSSDAFSLVQTNGLTAGSTIPLKIYFDAGDANIDSETDLLDVQHSLNYIFNEHQSAFNYIAADTYRDAAITVQDLITTINIVLDTDINNTAPYSFRSDSESNNQLFIENGKLVLYSEQPVAASDIRLQGISNKEILPLLDAAKFQSVFRNSQEGTRLIFFSPTRDVIPSGYTVLAELSGSNARLLSAVLASKEATRIPILIITTPTNMPVMTDNLKISIKGNVVHYYLPWNADDVTATLYTIRGEAIGRQVMNRVAAGSYEVNFNINHHSVYILNTVIRLEGQIISKNIKLVY